MSLFISALGLMMVLEGIPYFCFPEKVKDFARKIPEIPDLIMRGIGFGLIFLGLGAVYMGKNFV
tara:strand:+ start:324 stop:515 length:192 start_codon:yes stop_codon:yes gene_type:complete